MLFEKRKTPGRGTYLDSSLAELGYDSISKLAKSDPFCLDNILTV
jgi:hypothetical protein